MRLKFMAVCFFIAVFFTTFMRMDFVYADTLIVVVNYNLLHEKTLLPLEMTQKELKDIYLGNKESAQGTKLLLADQRDKKIFEEFISQFIGMSTTSYKSHWVKKLFSVGLSPPKVVDGPAEVIKYVSENQGAIGYVWKSNLKGSEKGVRAVTILP